MTKNVNNTISLVIQDSTKDINKKTFSAERTSTQFLETWVLEMFSAVFLAAEEDSVGLVKNAIEDKTLLTTSKFHLKKPPEEPKKKLKFQELKDAKFAVGQGQTQVLLLKFVHDAAAKAKFRTCAKQDLPCTSKLLLALYAKEKAD
jgi:hypothetical protein